MGDKGLRVLLGLLYDLRFAETYVLILLVVSIYQQFIEPYCGAYTKREYLNEEGRSIIDHPD